MVAGYRHVYVVSPYRICIHSVFIQYPLFADVIPIKIRITIILIRNARRSKTITKTNHENPLDSWLLIKSHVVDFDLFVVFSTPANLINNSGNIVKICTFPTVITRGSHDVIGEISLLNLNVNKTTTTTKNTSRYLNSSSTKSVVGTMTQQNIRRASSSQFPKSISTLLCDENDTRIHTTGDRFVRGKRKNKWSPAMRIGPGDDGFRHLFTDKTRCTIWVY